MSAKCDRDLIVTRRQQLAADQACRAVVTQLNLVLGVPAGIIADDCHKRQAVTNGGIDLCRVKAEGAVAHDRNDRRVGHRHTRGKRERQRCANGARDAVDHAMRRVKAGLSPLANFAAVGNENGVGVTVKQRLQWTKCLHRMQTICDAGGGVIPGVGAVFNCCAHVLAPCAVGCAGRRTRGDERIYR